MTYRVMPPQEPSVCSDHRPNTHAREGADRPGDPPRTPRTHAREEPATQSAPLRRAGRRCGYEGRDEVLAAAYRLTSALTELARDEDPSARRAGLLIARSVATATHKWADEATERSTKTRRDAERVAKALAALVDPPPPKPRASRRPPIPPANADEVALEEIAVNTAMLRRGERP